MADGSNVLNQASSLIEERLKDLDDERKRLERALADLRGTRRGPGRPRGSSAGGSGTTRRGSGSGGGTRRRRRRGGTRAEQALKHIEENPGIRASEIASRLNIKPNYVYRVMSDLEKDGKVEKRGREYHATSASSTPEPSSPTSSE